MAISYRQAATAPHAERLSNATFKLYNSLLVQYKNLSEKYNDLHFYLFEQNVKEETYTKEVADEIYEKVQQHNSLGNELSLLDAKIEVLGQLC